MEYQFQALAKMGWFRIKGWPRNYRINKVDDWGEYSLQENADGDISSAGYAADKGDHIEITFRRQGLLFKAQILYRDVIGEIVPDVIGTL